MAFTLSRRQALIAAGTAPLLAAVPGLALANDKKDAPQPHPLSHPLPHSKARGFKLGAFEVITLLAGSAPRPEPHKIFGLNVTDDEFANVSTANFIPADQAQFYFTPTLVRAGSNLILFDTGLNAAGITAALGAAGFAPQDITHVVITHMHGDHIGGLIGKAGETFPNAAYLTGQVEFDHWAKGDNGRFASNVKPLAGKMRFLKGGDSVASGITAVEAFGHTPGHMAYMLESNGQQLLLMADTANHYVWSLAYPDWEVKFDMDKEMAAKTRRSILGMLAADRVPLIGYHMPFPACGFVETRGEGFHYVPVSYQLMG